jgi:hypothetical protein
MNAYLYEVHNLALDNRFSKLNPETKSAIVSYLTDSLGDLCALQEAIINESGPEVLNFINEHLDLKKHCKGIIFSTQLRSYIENVDFNCVRAIIDFKKINNIQHTNGLLRAVNDLLPEGGIYIGRLETYWEKKLRIYRKYGSQIGRLIWIGDFILNRVIPRIFIAKSLYYLITGGKYRSMSSAEILGRLVYCGFAIKNFTVIDGITYFVVEKKRKPYKVNQPSFYPLIKLQRIGQHGKLIEVYKFRTMHPYSEFLQDYVIKLYGYNKMGKPDHDFRLTRWGKWMRRLSIDELPQLINILKGEMKLVGLRPLSRVRYKEFPEDLRCERIKYKPGCIPPYIALCMPDDKLNIEAERIYIQDIIQNPRWTDFIYFSKAVLNMITFKVLNS